MVEHLHAAAVASDIINIAFFELDIYPVPGIVTEHFYLSSVIICPYKHVSTIKCRITTTSFGK